MFGALSQSADTLSTRVNLSEVDVVAIKQSDRNRSGATTVVDRSHIERERMLSARQLSDMVPNLFMPDYGSRMTSSIYVRGLGARIDQPAMGLSIDNIPILCKENYDIDLPDMARMEMLRGPQSTLHGRNTMGGLMNITTLSPFVWQGTRLLLESASAGAVKAGASHYSRLSDRVALMAGLYYTRGDGTFRNAYNGRLIDWERQLSGRLKLEWRPGNRWTVANTAMFAVNRQGGYPYEYLETGQIAYNDTCFYRRTSLLDGLTVSYHWDNVSLTSATSYQYIDDNMTLDQDFTPLPYFTLTQARHEHAVTQDFVLKGTAADSRYSWTTGAFGFFRRYRMDAPVTFRDTGIRLLIEDRVNELNPYYPIAWDSREFELGSRFTCPTWGAALYHESSYRHGGFTVTAGLRLDYEHTRLNYHSFTNTGYSVLDSRSGGVYRHDDIDIDESGTLNKHFIQLLPKIGLSYRWSNDGMWQQVRLSWSKGYKAGGFNTQMFSDVLQQKLMGMMGIGASYDVDRIVGYNPEVAWNYEAGYSLATYDGKWKLDAALFYIDCRDRQMTVFPDGTTTGRVMTNAGKTRSIGAELSVTAMPVKNLELNASYGWCRATFVDYDNGRQRFDGNYVPYCPLNTIYAGARYAFELNVSDDWCRTLAADIDCRANGDIYWNEDNSLRQPLYALLGASITLEGRRGSLQLWGRNLTGTHYDTFYFVSVSHEFLQHAQGRALGATLRLNF